MLRLSLLTLILPFIAFSQQNKQSAFTIDYNYQIPIGILSKTYGNSSELLISYGEMQDIKPSAIDCGTVIHIKKLFHKI